MEEGTSASLEAGNNNMNAAPSSRLWKRCCCVPKCDNNNRKNPELSFHKIPKNPELKKKWLRVLKRKGLMELNSSHRVCSAHFAGGIKTYMNNIPTIFAKATKSTPRKKPMERKTINVRDDLDIPEVSSHVESTTPDSNVQNNDNNNEVSKLKEEILSLQAKNTALQKKYDKDTADLKCGLFRMERFIASDADFRFYTGFPNYNSFKALFDYLSPACEHLVYHGTTTAPITSEHQIKCGKPRLMSPEQELFLVLIRLRLGLLVQDIAHRFNTSASHVSRIFKTWIVFLNQRFRALPIWPSRKFVDDNMPACFKVAYPKTRVIIDCTEVFIETPSSCRSQSITFSSYKHHNTAKGLIGISPSGYPSFFSSLYAGRVSDKKITNDCGILKLLEPGDELMADRGFDIESDIPDGVSLNIPPFLDGQPHVATTRKIASVRVHVERAIARIKNYRILQHNIPLTLSDNLEQIWTVCSYLTLFLPPMIKETQP